MTQAQSLEPSQPFEELREQKQQFYLFGLHLGKSRAPLLCNTIFKHLGLNWNYQIKETDDAAVFNQTFADENCIGSAVTMPNKIRFQTEVDLTDEVGSGVGAINTVYTRRSSTGKVLRIGTNTDTVGIRESFLQTPEAATVVKNNNGRPGLVYGGGGASRSAVFALHKFFGCETVYIVNREKSEVDDLINTLSKSIPGIKIVHIETPEQARLVEKPVLAVLCVPNFPAKTPQETTARSTLDVFIKSSQGAVLEMCYHPVIITELYKDFEQAGWTVINGVVAMIYQGLAQVSFWGGYSLEELPIEQAKNAVLSDIQKIT